VKNQEEYEEKEIAMDGMFVAIGHLPNTKIFAGKIDLDERGFVKRKEIFEDGLLKYWSATNIEGVFVAGDVSDYRYMQAVTAAGFGCIAALDAQRWLQKIN
jgi:thioredoxin reductase (NADPH)